MKVSSRKSLATLSTLREWGVFASVKLHLADLQCPTSTKKRVTDKIPASRSSHKFFRTAVADLRRFKKYTKRGRPCAVVHRALPAQNRFFIASCAELFSLFLLNCTRQLSNSSDNSISRRCPELPLLAQRMLRN